MYIQEKGLALVSPRDTKAPRVLVPLKDCPEGKVSVYLLSIHLLSVISDAQGLQPVLCTLL